MRQVQPAPISARPILILVPLGAVAAVYGTAWLATAVFHWPSWLLWPIGTAFAVPALARGGWLEWFYPTIELPDGRWVCRTPLGERTLGSGKENIPE